jgi:hypothetical protein
VSELDYGVELRADLLHEPKVDLSSIGDRGDGI